MASDYDRIRAANLREYGEGTRHLEFFRRLYADNNTHFIFELLQNAEDAGATSVRFEIFPERLELRHNGRVFNEQDVKGVCGVGEGTKEQDLTQIGKFGIGFKSVYAYTRCPEIHSGDEHFCIEDYVRPRGVPSRTAGDGWTTLFVFLNSGKGVGEVGTWLQNLDWRALLFLRHIKHIEWSVGQAEGRYSRDVTPRGNGRQLRIKGEGIADEEWLVFERPVATPDHRADLRVECAFQLSTDKTTGGERISRIEQSPLVVFFPTEKETHLGFLIQGPFRTTPTRENIPADDAWNRRLVLELATLVAETLSVLRDIDLLTVSVLSAMPIDTSNFGESSLFRPIFESVRDAIRQQPLVPAHGGGFAAAAQLKLARGAELRGLLSEAQLGELLGGGSAWRWASDEITADRTPQLRRYFVEALGIDEVTPEKFAGAFNAKFIAGQTNEWVVRFYRFLHGQPALWRKPKWAGDPPGPIRNSPFLRLQAGNPIHVQPFAQNGAPNAYLPTAEDTDYPTVRREIVADETVRLFLKNLGLSEPSPVTEVNEKVLPKYRSGNYPADWETHAQDIAKILRALQATAQDQRNALLVVLKETPFLCATNVVTGEKSFRRPDKIYLKSAELELYFESNRDAYFLAAEYSPEESEALCRLGVARSIRVAQRPPDFSGHVPLGRASGYYYVRGMHGFDPAAEIDGLQHALEHRSEPKTLYIWNTLLIANRHLLRGKVQSATRSDFKPADVDERLSTVGQLTQRIAWLPGRNGTLHRPSELSLEDLPPSFERDEALARMLSMKSVAPDPIQILAEQKGVPADAIKYLCENLADFQKWQASRSVPQFPERDSPNAGLRRKRVAEETAGANPKEYEKKERSVRTSDDVQSDARAYLRDLYTNEDKQMVCQVCRREMPFTLDDGKYFFEAVECVKGDDRELRENHLALCPLCAAKYRYALGTDAAQIHQDILQANSLDVPVRLARKDETISFVRVHLEDLRAVP